MPLVSREQADINRRKILDASARLFRERGFAGVSVSDLMAAAGLTHGGFYGQFDSKDALAAEACARAFEEGVGSWTRRVAGKPTAAARRQALIEGYLTPQNRDDPGRSCATATLVNDVAREVVHSPVREAYRVGLESLIAILAAAQAPADAGAARQAALADFATLVGAIVMSRATRGSPVSNEILAAARDRLQPRTGQEAKSRVMPHRRSPRTKA